MLIEMTISVGRCLKRKTMLARVKEYINKNFATYKSLCSLQKLYAAFKQKHLNVNIRFAKICALRPKWCALAGSNMTHSVCVCSAHKIYLWSLSNHHYSQEYFFNWNITSSSYLEMLLINMIKSLFLFFLSNRKVRCCFL